MNEKSWKELTTGAINLEAGNSLQNHTGTFRSGEKPIFKEETCIHCLFCWVFCPDSAITVKGNKVKGIDYDYCKGCGICVIECPTKPKSLEMVVEEIYL